MQLGIAQTFGKHRLFALQLLYRQLYQKLYTIFCVSFLKVIPFCTRVVLGENVEVLGGGFHSFCLSMRQLYVIMSDNKRLKEKLFCKMTE